MKSPLLLVLTLLPCLAWAQTSTDTTDTSSAPDSQSHQGPPHGPPDPDKIVEHLTQELQLTSSQQDQIKQILQTEFAQMKTIHEDTTLTDDQKHQQMTALYQDSKKQIEGVLTPDQVTKFDQMRPPGPGGRGGPMNADAILDHLTKSLQLTSDEQDQIKPILQAEFTQMKSIHDDTTLSDDQKHQQMETLHQDTAKQIEAVLTPDQVTKFEQMHQHHGP
jgi:Spy/CpxP family protein refolding chaperone